MNRIVLAFRAFFSLLFSGELSGEILISLNLSRRSASAPAKAAVPGKNPNAGTGFMAAPAFDWINALRATGAGLGY